MSDKQLNYWSIAFYGVIIGAVVLAVIYFLPIENNPVKAFVALIASKLNLPALDLSNISGLVTGNWGSIAAVGVTAIPLAYTAFSSWAKKKKAEEELKLAQELAEKSKQAAEAKLSGLQSQIDGYASDTTADTLQQSLGKIGTENTLLKEQVAKLQAQNELLAQEPARMAQQLWAKSGGQIIEVGGEKYKIIKEEIIKVL